MRVLFLLLLSTALALAQEILVQNCTGNDIPLTCNNRGYCVVAEANFTGYPLDSDGNFLPPHESNSTDGRSCVCETGFTGVNCETTMQFCDGNIHACLNGGTCVEGRVQSTGAIVHVCDCMKALDEITGNYYVGLHCETTVPTKKDPSDTETNPESGANVCDEEGKLYCVHEGTCLDPLKPGKQICDCEADYVGYHCEYKRSGSEGFVEAVHKNCNLGCQNGGTCYVGTRNATDAEQSFDTNFMPNVLEKFQHCRCPQGFAGIFCENMYTNCGENHCFHDSECQQAAVAAEPSCKCTNNVTHNFAGSSCQAHSTSFCSKSPGLNGHQFCTNKGECLDIGNGLYNCTCPTAYQGQHCEFPKSLPKPVAHLKCDLKCENGGKCMEGTKTHGILSGFSDIGHIINPTTAAAIRHEYCDCPTGFAGGTCEHKAELCPNGQHVCFHGGKCVSGESGYQCNCLDSSSSLPGKATAGAHCQHKSTTVCDATRKKFCVNNGKCKEDLSCECFNNYRGPYCELKKKASSTTSGAAKDAETAAKLPENYQDNSNQSIIISSAVVGGIAILAIIVTVSITGTSAEDMPMAQMSSPSINVPPDTMFPPVSPPASSANRSAVMTDVQDGSVQDLNYDDGKEGEAAIHVNELI